LRPFKKHGGKIIHYHGWTDMALTPLNSIAYYNEVKAKVGRNIQDFYRMFMVPGMGHCGGGPGANQFGAYVDPPVVDADHDLLSALDNWVEHGTAPTKIIATHFVDNDPKNSVAFQRPLCVYPQVAHYDSKGDPNKADSFTCR
jgi:feruloyl esterase